MPFKLNLDSSFFGDVKSYICKLVKAIKLQITRIHQITGSEQDLSPGPSDSGRRETVEGRDFLPCGVSSPAGGK